jgi:hypothetical protein
MNLTTGDLLVIFLVEGTLVSFFVFTILFLKKSFPPPSPERAKAGPRKKKSADDVRLDDLLKESEAISRDLAQNLQEKKEVVARLIGALDEKIHDLNRVLEKVNETRPPLIGETAPPQQDSEVLALARTGFPVSDIARRLGRSKEEVQLVLDLEKIAVN